MADRSRHPAGRGRAGAGRFSSGVSRLGPRAQDPESSAPRRHPAMDRWRHHGAPVGVAGRAGRAAAARVDQAVGEAVSGGFRLSCGGSFVELFDALRASRKRAAELDEAVEVSSGDGIIMGVSLPPSNRDGRPQLAKAQKSNTLRRATLPAPTKSSNICEETDRPHVWWLHEGEPSWTFRCNDCRAWGYQLKGKVCAQRCRACPSAATHSFVDGRGRKRWSCKRHAIR